MMKMFRLLGALLISLMLMLTGCLKIDITAGSGIQGGDPGKKPMCPLNGNGKCICGPTCTCYAPYQCAP